MPHVDFVDFPFNAVDFLFDPLDVRPQHLHLRLHHVQPVVHHREGLLDLEVPGLLRSLAGGRDPGGEGPVGVRGEDVGLLYRVVREERAEDDRILEEDGPEDPEEPQKP